MDQIKEMVQPLYDSGDLLGFSIFGERGEAILNESFLCDETAWLSTRPFVDIIQKLDRAHRSVNRLTVELDDVILIYKEINNAHVLFALSKTCDLDAALSILP